GVFRADGPDRWIAIAVEDDAAWARLARAIERPELADDPRFATLVARKRHEDDLEAVVTGVTHAHGAEETTARPQAAGVAAFVSASNRDLAEDPHLAERGFFVDLPHPEVGVRRHLGMPWHFSASPSRVAAPAPCLGADTDDVLRSVCGTRRTRSRRYAGRTS